MITKKLQKTQTIGTDTGARRALKVSHGSVGGADGPGRASHAPERKVHARAFGSRTPARERLMAEPVEALRSWEAGGDGRLACEDQVGPRKVEWVL
jgi:hypothetical protein